MKVFHPNCLFFFFKTHYSATLNEVSRPIGDTSSGNINIFINLSGQQMQKLQSPISQTNIRKFGQTDSSLLLDFRL